MDEQLPAFAFDPTPRQDACETCGARHPADLRFVIFRGRSRYLGRTLCDVCAEGVLEALLTAEPEAETAT